MMVKKKEQEHTIDELEELFARISEKFQWLGDYL